MSFKESNMFTVICGVIGWFFFILICFIFTCQSCPSNHHHTCSGQAQAVLHANCIRAVGYLLFFGPTRALSVPPRIWVPSQQLVCWGVPMWAHSKTGLWVCSDGAIVAWLSCKKRKRRTAVLQPSTSLVQGGFGRGWAVLEVKEEEREIVLT